MITFFLSSYFQEAPAETTDYMIAGFAVIFGLMFLYLVSLNVRNRNLKLDLEILEEQARETKSS
jgi:hypothetical protein